MGVTILIYKKGDPAKVDNFRPITLQSVPYKIFSSFIRNRLQAFLDINKYHNNAIQKGFAHGQDGVLEHTEMLDFMMKEAKKTTEATLRSCLTYAMPSVRFITT